MDGMNEIFQVDRLGNETVGMQAVRGENVPLGL
jgi:hypothetical protein